MKLKAASDKPNEMPISEKTKNLMRKNELMWSY